MHASLSQLYILLVALLATAVVADSLHDSNWSRRHRNRAIARSQPASRAAEVVQPPTKKRVRRSKTCKTPSNSTVSASSSPSATATHVLEASASATKSSAKAATSTKAYSSTQDAATSSKAPATTKTSTKTSTTAKSAPTGSSTGGGALSLAALFPAGTPGDSWTTSPKSSSALSLSDSTFQLTHLLSALTHSYMAAPDGKKAMQATYPKGSYTFTHDPQGGFSFYAPGPNSLDMTKAKTLTLGYSVFFEDGFDFNLGGKLPGLYGGNSAEVAISCSGGRRSTECYSARFMFREQGEGELYTYLPDYTVSGFAANKAVCDLPPFSTCNPTYGASVARGSWTFATGAWTTISQRVQLNDVGQANGQIQVWANGKEVINVDGLILRDSDSGRHRGIQMQTFFGGSQPEYASPKTQKAYFSDFSVAIIDEL